VRITFADNGCIDVHHFISDFHTVNGNCDTVRNLFLQAVQCFFTDQFRHDLTLRLVCDGIFIIELRSVWEIFHDHFHQFIRIVTVSCGYRNDFCKVIDIFVRSDGRKNIFLLYTVYLIDDQYNRCRYFLKLADDMLFTCTDKCCRLYKPEYHIYFIQRTFCHIDHIFSKLILGFMDSRCIYKYDLTIICGQYRLNAVTCRLWLVRCDRNLLSDQLVHQS